MKKIYLALLICFITNTSIAQTLGFTYQAVIINPNTQNIPGNDIEDGLLSESDILIRFTIENNAGTEYQETHATTTDVYGMINIMVGQGQVNIGNFSEIVWGGDEKFLKVEIDFSASGSTYEDLDRQQMTYLPQPMSNATMAIFDQINSDLTNNSSAIDAEVIRAKAAEQANMNAIALEAARANSAEQVNSNKIGVLQIISNSNTIAIATEQARATAAEQANANAISTNASDISTANTNISSNASAITAEENRAIAAEQANANAISTNASDISTANTNISSNASAITAEENRATAAEQWLGNTMFSGDSSNTAAIVAETARAQAAEQWLGNTMFSGDSSNTAAIVAEIARAQAAEVANTNAISINASDIATNATNFANIDYAQIFGIQLTQQGLPVNTLMTGPLQAQGNDIVNARLVNVTGNLTGNAVTATKLQTARNIGGIAFNGTSNINLPGVNTTGNQNTTGNAATATKIASITNSDIVQLDATQTLRNKTLNSPLLQSPTLSGSFLGGNSVIGLSPVDQVGFFGSTGNIQQTVANFSLPAFGWGATTTDLYINQLAIESKINEIITVLRAYGLIQ